MFDFFAKAKHIKVKLGGGGTDQNQKKPHSFRDREEIKITIFQKSFLGPFPIFSSPGKQQETMWGATLETEHCSFVLFFSNTVMIAEELTNLL